MAFTRLTIRTKKSLSGLYSSSNDHASQVPEATLMATKPSIEPPGQYDLNEFGMPSNENASPARESPSRRTRLLGSLRSIGSLRSLRTTHSQSKQSHSEGSMSEAESPCTPVKKMPSLALGFEVSPPDKPMFDTVTRQVSNSSSLEVLHSSPVTVGRPNKQRLEATPLPPRPSSFVVGHPPESPAPLQRVSVQKSILATSSHTASGKFNNGSPISQRSIKADPNPTPMPGTNLTLDDVAGPGKFVQSPSTPSLDQDYFNMIPAECGSQEYDYSTVLSDQLSIDDPKFDEMVAMGPTKDSTNISQTSLKQRHLQPYSNAAVSATSEHDSSVARKNSPHQHTTSHVSAATDKLPNELAYLFWNATTTANESVAWQEHQPRVWSCYTGSPNSAKCSSATASMNARAVSSECKGETCPATAQDLSKASLTIHGKAIIKKTTKSVAQPQPRSSEDDKSELQNLIRSYAGSMLYHSDAPEEQGTDVVSEFLGEENPAIGQVAKEEIKAEVELATRVMNRSLGG